MDGTCPRSWSGDLTAFSTTLASWPFATTSDFAGERATRTRDVGEGHYTIVTPWSHDFYGDTTWSVYFGGNSADITANKDVNFYLALSLDNPALIESGAVSGYRLRLGDATGTGTADSLFFEMAAGSGWSTVSETDLGANANLNQGWNVAVHRDADGLWSWGSANGVIGQTPVLAYSAAETTVLSAFHTGMGWRTTATDANKFGFDEFRIAYELAPVAPIPEPSSALLMAIGAAVLLGWRRRRGGPGR